MARSARPKGVLSAPFGLSLLIFALTPTQIGFQDVGTLVARQPAVSSHWGQHLRASAFGTIHVATFNFGRPIGTYVPQPLSYQLASLDPRMVLPAPWEAPDDPMLQFPTVNRGVKGDREAVLHPAPPAPETTKAPEAPAAEDRTPVAEAVDKPEAEVADSDVPDPVDSVVAGEGGFTDDEPTVDMARLYLDGKPLGDAPPAEEEPAIAAPAVPATPPVPEATDIKQSALDRSEKSPDKSSDADKGGETIAPKGQVTGEGKRPMTPAERLHLEGKDRAKAEKCLADAVYFESRGEPVRGQIAVAQVVMNRVFSGYYPRNVCATVYQNKHRRLACQFTFACDGIPDVVTEPQAWVRATRIAKDVLDGKYWVPEVNRATHYHAYWVRPSWVREMKRLYKVGVHTFYRPRAWGDGSDSPSWGSAAATNEAVAKL